MANTHKLGAGPLCSLPPNPAELGMGEGKTTSASLLSSVLSLCLIYGEIGRPGRVGGAFPRSRGWIGCCPGLGLRRWDAASPELLRGFAKGTQTSWRRGSETRRSISRFKMQIPPLYFRWRGQGLPISSSPPLPPALLPPSWGSFV